MRYLLHMALLGAVLLGTSACDRAPAHAASPPTPHSAAPASPGGPAATYSAAHLHELNRQACYAYPVVVDAIGVPAKSPAVVLAAFRPRPRRPLSNWCFVLDAAGLAPKRVYRGYVKRALRHCPSSGRRVPVQVRLT